MYDSTTAADIPADAEVVAGYVDGLYRWSDADWARFPNAAKVRITIDYTNMDADVLDCESGDATPEQAAVWLRNGGKTVYCNVSTKPAVDTAYGRSDWEWWAAHYTFVEHLEDGSVATQYADHGPNGEHYDVSLCAAGWPSG